MAGSTQIASSINRKSSFSCQMFKAVFDVAETADLGELELPLNVKL
jgi:hypothetical protein